ncbi:MAG: hypothetical protein M1330_02095 [Armatimonadetes bacterium]|nr:hypothetical protein [Armatimonadota bacterium]
MRPSRKKVRKLPNYALRAIPIVIIILFIIWVGWFAPWDHPSAEAGDVLYYGQIMSPPADQAAPPPNAAHTGNTAILKR